MIREAAPAVMAACFAGKGKATGGGRRHRVVRNGISWRSTKININKLTACLNVY